MKKIILPTDFSANAQKAIDYAIHLFKNEPCKFYLLHAYHSAPSSPGNKQTAKSELKNFTQMLKANRSNEDHHFKAIVITNSIINALEKTIKKKEADYVFMGTKGSSALQEIFMGSNTVSVIKYLENCPIMAVPSDYDLGSTKEILFATDFKHAFTPSELRPLIQIAKLGGSALAVVHIKAEEQLSGAQKANKILLEKSLESVNSKFMEVAMNDTITSTIFELGKENKNIGMVALLKTQHGYFDRLLREPILKNIASKTELPFLVLPKI